MKKNKFYTIVILIMPLLLFAVFFLGNVSRDKAINGGIDCVEALVRIDELTGDAYEGRQMGTPGGEKASEYIKNALREQGIQSLEGEGYGISFDATTAIVESAEFKIEDMGAGFADTLEIYKDYNPVTKGLGGSIDYAGQILLAVGPIEYIPGHMLAGRVVAARTSNLTHEAKIHVLRSGGQGILYYDDSKTGGFEIERKSIDASGKSIESIFTARITGEVYDKLIDGAEDGVFDGAEIRVKIGFPYIAGENIIACIPAPKSDEYLIIATGYDGYGAYGETGHVPGAIDNASGISGLLELSEKLSKSNMTPSKNLVFMFLDGEKTGAAGMNEYIKNPLFPLEKTELIFLENLGWKNSDKTSIAYDAGSNSSENLAERIIQDYEKTGLEAFIEDAYLEGSPKALSDAGVPAVMLAGASREELKVIAGTPKDNSGQWDENVFTENLSVCLDFVEADCYDMPYSGYVDMGAAMFGLILMALLYVSYAFHTLHRRHPGACFGSKSISGLYFSTPRILAEGLSSFVMLALATIALTAFAVNLHLLDLHSFHGASERLYSFIKNIKIEEFNNLFNEGLALSVGLVSASAAIAFTAGLFAGMHQGTMRIGKSEGRGILPIMVLSLPQAFIALGLLYVSTIYMRVYMADGGVSILGLETLIFPVISMTIVPFVWFYGEVSSMAQGEMVKDYVLLARARGFTRANISRHVFKGLFISSVKRIPELMAIVLSNLIVGEYIFGLPGITNRLLVEIKSPETAFSAMLLIGVVYIVSVLLSKALVALLNPKGGY
ncbi:MAG: M28 family peptidase [Peptostreptococcaceae bacterium]|nr:M28 family peptidase [Peptostreptococcaceae bacterium]